MEKVKMSKRMLSELPCTNVPPEKVEEIIRVIAVTNNVNTTASLFRTDPSVIRKIVDINRDKLTRYREIVLDYEADLCLDIASRAGAMITDEKLKACTAVQLSLVRAVQIDKHLLLTGKPTERHELSYMSDSDLDIEIERQTIQKERILGTDKRMRLAGQR